MRYFASPRPDLRKTFFARRVRASRVLGEVVLVCMVLLCSCRRQTTGASMASRSVKSHPPSSPEPIERVSLLSPNRPASGAGRLGKPELERFTELARRDFKEAIRQAKALPISSDRAEAFSKIAEVLFAENLSALPELIAATSTSLERDRVISEAIRLWGRRNPKYLYEAGKAQSNATARNTLQSRAIGFAARDKNFEEARQMLDEMRPSAARNQAFQGFADAYYKASPQEALAWVKSLPRPDDQRSAYSKILSYGEGTRSIDTLNAILQGSSDPQIISKTVEAATRVLIAQQGAGAALTWIGALPASERDAATCNYMRLGDVRDTAKMLPLIQSMKTASQRSEALDALFSRMMETSPSLAAAKAVALPEDIRAEGICAMVSNWYNVDSIGLSEWVNAQAPGAVRDGALSQMARLLSRSDPETARHTAMAIQDQTLKDRTLRDIRPKR